MTEDAIGRSGHSQDLLTNLAESGYSDAPVFQDEPPPTIEPSNVPLVGLTEDVTPDNRKGLEARWTDTYKTEAVVPSEEGPLCR